MQIADTITDRLRRGIDAGRRYLDALTARERRLVYALALVFLLFVTVLPVYLLTAAVSSLHTENDELRAVIREFGRKESQLREVAALRKAQTARYNRTPPQLSTFLSEKAQSFGIEVREFSDQPDKQVGFFKRHHVRVQLPNGIGLRALMKFFEAIENSPFPIAIEKVKIEHYQPGDSYNGVEVDVISFERSQGKPQ